MKSALTVPKNAPNSSVIPEEGALAAPSILRRILRVRTCPQTADETSALGEAIQLVSSAPSRNAEREVATHE